jgi:hypothetical protein
MSIFTIHTDGPLLRIQLESPEIVCALNRVAEVLEALLASQTPPPVKEELHFMYTVKDDTPGGRYSITGGDSVTDAEGNVITDPAVLASLMKSFVADNPDALVLTPDADDPFNGSYEFGGPGVATATAKITNADGTKILASGTASFTVTTGDPNAVSPITLQFGDLVETPPAPAG